MWSLRAKGVALAGASAAVGATAGVCHERRKRHLSPVQRRPGHPLFGTVSAATPVAPAPVVVVPEVPIPSKETGLPTEPLPGTNRIAEIMRFGFPGLDNIRSRRDYVLSYDRRTRIAHWVFEHLTRDNLRRSDDVDRAKSDFKEDQSVHPHFKSSNADFKYSGYDRGHLAAAGNHRQTQESCDETFLLSNIAPQVGPGFNRDKWEHLERYVRSLTKLYRNVYVCTGPLFLPRAEADGKRYVRYEVIGMSNVAVPTHFFKVVVCETEDRSLELEAYVMPNQAIPDETPLASFQVPPDSIERAAGLLFFDRIARDRLKKINGKKTGGFFHTS